MIRILREAIDVHSQELTENKIKELYMISELTLPLCFVADI